MKYCNSCETEKEEGFFCKRKASVDGLSPKCKSCQKVYDKARSGDKHRVMARKIYAQTDIGRLSGNKAKADYSKRNPKKVKAMQVVNNAIRAGKLFKEGCSQCGETHRTHAHHDDYSKPLNIRWLCPKCHYRHHELHGEALNP